MKQTAVEWVFEQLFNSFEKFNNGECTFNEYLKKNLEIKEQAKEMEKQQHQETFKQSRLAKIFEKSMPPVWESWEQYYNETYNK
jgi:hypothetical protein